MRDSCCSAGVPHAVSMTHPIDRAAGFDIDLCASCGVRVVPPGHTTFAIPATGTNPSLFTRPTATFCGGDPTTFKIVYLCAISLMQQNTVTGKVSQIRESKHPMSRERVSNRNRLSLRLQVKHETCKMSTYAKFHLSRLVEPGESSNSPLAAMSALSEVALIAAIASLRLSVSPVR